MGYLGFLVYPLLGAFLGYITNYLAPSGRSRK
jgi:uncharacterized membrane protein YheB (UPF0754 family)